MSDCCADDPARTEAMPVAVDWTVLPQPAEIDVANAEHVRRDLLAAVDRGYPVVIADMSTTAVCDCAGVAALRCARHYAARAGAELRIVAQEEPVLRVFRLTGLLVDLPVYRTTAAALPGVGEDCGLAQSAPT